MNSSSKKTICLLAFMLSLTFSTTVVPALGQEVLLETAYESGTTCKWDRRVPDSGECDLTSLLESLEQATTQEENLAALLAALETTTQAGLIPPSLQEGLEAAAELQSEFPDTKAPFMKLSDAHEWATIGIDNAPLLSEVLTEFANDVAAAYQNPTDSNSATFILMFSTTSPPGPEPTIDSEVKLTLLGTVLYSQWLWLDSSAAPAPHLAQESLPQLPETGQECAFELQELQRYAVLEIVGRNLLSLSFSLFNTLLNISTGIVTCFTAGTGEAVLFLEDVASCGLSFAADFVEVEADATCVGDAWDSGPFLADVAWCVNGAIPCVGDWLTVVEQAVASVGVIENMVNGVCSVAKNYGPLFDQCSQQCPQGQDVEVEPPCNAPFYSCFDPVNAVPEVTCQQDTTGVLDQFQETRHYSFWFERTVVRWQEFAPTLDNLTAVEVFVTKVGSPGNVVIEITSDSGTVLGARTISVSSSDWIEATFDPPLSLTPGGRFRIRVSSDADSPGPSNRYYWQGDTDSAYPCLDCLTDVSDGWPDYDYAFRTYGYP